MVDEKQNFKKLLAFKKDASFAIFKETVETNKIIKEIQISKEKEIIPTEVIVQVNTKLLEDKISDVIVAINKKENKEVNLLPLISLLEDIKGKKYPKFSTQKLSDSIEKLAMEIKADRLVDRTNPENPELLKSFEELIKKIEELLKKQKKETKSIIGGWGSDSVYVYNTSGAKINSATSEKQDTQIAHIANVVSTVNSTATPLGISGVFTGTAEDISKYGSVSVSAFSDKVSATNGLSLQFSSNGTNWDNIDAHTTVANVAHVTTNAVQYKYFRVVYTNGAVAQTSFRLQTIYATESIGPIIEEMGGDVSDTTSALTTKSVLFAKNPAGVYGSINRTTGGNLKVSIEEVEAGAVLPTSEIVPTNIEGLGKVSIGTTATIITFAGTTRGIIISADTANTGTLYIGKSNVTSAGANAVAFLEAGESLTIDYNDATNALYVVASAVSQNYFAGATL